MYFYTPFFWVSEALQFGLLVEVSYYVIFQDLNPKLIDFGLIGKWIIDEMSAKKKQMTNPTRCIDPYFSLRGRSLFSFLLYFLIHYQHLSYFSYFNVTAEFHSLIELFL